ncbi:hypothetical protein FGG08_004392 [Glutinoglossum americanum]|uniref:NACHT domain-containing protein n=1 Tax=Glutinoglossum americanum TaxID=1670608 RepID=A0A9P8I0I0_9PEZI|nr:hypothetical protein FGG08_004392 [Glutinoglossum americanum]
MAAVSSTTSTVAPPFAVGSDLRQSNPSGPSLVADYGPILGSWSKAVDLFNSRLTKDDKKKINLKDFQRASFMELLDAATAAKSKVEKERYSWTGNVQNVFRQINRYAVAGDMIVQHHAEYTSLAWGAFRFLLMFTVEEGKTSERLSEALESTVQIVFRAEEYAKLFSSHSGSSTERIFLSLQENLTHLYAEVLNFLIRATIFFEKPAWRRYVSAGLSPYDAKLGSILDRVGVLERNVEKDVALLNLETIKLQQEYENGVWLKHADFTADLRKLQESHVPGTCEWFLRSDAYMDWRELSANSQGFNLLWVQGKPGSGKSTLASQIIRDLQSGEGNVVLYVFCKDGEENKDNLESILRNLVFQLLEKFSSDKRFHTLVRNARLNEKSLFVQPTEVLWLMLEWMLRESNRTYCVLDGLDECSNSTSERASFFMRLTEAFKMDGHTAKLAIISRLDQSEAAEESSFWKCVQVRPSEVRADIEKFAETRLRSSRVLNAHPERGRVLKLLVDSSDGMILWTELMIKELEMGHWNVQRVLMRPPRGLSEVYTSILHRISGTKAPAERVQRALQLILAAARPLRLRELALGLAVAEGLRSHEDYELRGDPAAECKEVLLESNPLLIAMPDETVQLAHTSLKDYLLSSRVPSTLPAFQFQVGGVHHTMASVLISYLSFQCFEAGLSEQMQEEYHLLEYASVWLVHHSTEAEDSIHVAEKLVLFFQTAQGWKWLQRLQGIYGLSYGHLLLMQSQLKHWAQAAAIGSEHRTTLGSFLLVLAWRQYEDAKVFPTDHPSLLQAMASLAAAYSDHGNFPKALDLMEQVVEARKRALGAEHPDTLSAIGYLVLIYMNQGRWKEAEELGVQVLEVRKKVLGAEHPDTLSAMGNLASTYWNQGRWGEAEELEVQLLETRKKVLGAEHPDTLLAISNLASTYWNQGRWKEAEELGVQVLETRKKVLGAEHPDTLSAIGNLASTYWNQGRWKEAEELGVQVLEVRKKVLGAEHPDTLSAIGNLASTYRNQGRWKEAEELGVQALETRKKVLGAEHPDTLSAIGNLASTYRNQGRWKEAEELGVQALETRKKVLGAEHPDTLSAIGNLASTYWNQGRWKEAEELEVQLLETRKKVLGAEHPDTLTTMSNLAFTWKSQSKDEDAIGLMEEVVRLRREKLGPDHPYTVDSAQSLYTWQEAQKPANPPGPSTLSAADPLDDTIPDRAASPPSSPAEQASHLRTPQSTSPAPSTAEASPS